MRCDGVGANWRSVPEHVPQVAAIEQPAQVKHCYMDGFIAVLGATFVVQEYLSLARSSGAANAEI